MTIRDKKKILELTDKTFLLIQGFLKYSCMDSNYNVNYSFGTHLLFRYP